MAQPSLVIMLDVDNTLLDNDRVKHDMNAKLHELLAPADAARFWHLYEAVRDEIGVVDFPLTLTRFQAQYEDAARFQELAEYFNTFPYTRYIYPATFSVLAHL